MVDHRRLCTCNGESVTDWKIIYKMYQSWPGANSLTPTILAYISACLSVLLRNQCSRNIAILSRNERKTQPRKLTAVPAELRNGPWTRGMTRAWTQSATRLRHAPGAEAMSPTSLSSTHVHTPDATTSCRCESCSCRLKWKPPRPLRRWTFSQVANKYTQTS